MPYQDSDLTALLRSLPARPRLLGLGEPTHGVEALPLARNRAFRHLVEHEGYRAIAVESDLLAGLKVDAYVTEGVGKLEEVLAEGFSHGFGEAASMRELVEWMRAYNLTHDEKIHFFGFDAPLEIESAPSPRHALAVLHAYLGEPLPWESIDALLGDEARWADTEAVMDPSRSIGRSPEAQRLRIVTDDLLAMLDTEAPALIARTSREAWWRAYLHGRAALGLLRYHAQLAEDSPERISRCGALRDAMMADNLHVIAELYGPVLVFGHNAHLQRQAISMSMWQGEVSWWGAGALVAARLGTGYAFVAGALGTVPETGDPEPDTVEGRLAAIPGEAHLVTSVPGDGALVPRVSATYKYAPLDPTTLDQIDGILFVRN